jgi:hypothetical protein
MRLRIPVPATDLEPDNAVTQRTTFTRAALRELLALLKECEPPCPAHPEHSGDGSPKP